MFEETSIHSIEKSKYLEQYSSHFALEISSYVSKSEQVTLGSCEASSEKVITSEEILFFLLLLLFSL